MPQENFRHAIPMTLWHFQWKKFQPSWALPLPPFRLWSAFHVIHPMVLDLNYNQVEIALLYLYRLHHWRHHCVPWEGFFLQSQPWYPPSNMEAVSGQISPDFETKRFNALKGDRMVYIDTFNPISTSPGDALMVPVPKLYEREVLVPGSFALKFNVTVSGHVNNYFVNNIARALVDRLTVKTL